jgi:hypothetical protein
MTYLTYEKLFRLRKQVQLARYPSTLGEGTLRLVRLLMRLSRRSPACRLGGRGASAFEEGQRADETADD